MATWSRMSERENRETENERHTQRGLKAIELNVCYNRSKNSEPFEILDLARLWCKRSTLAIDVTRHTRSLSQFIFLGFGFTKNFVSSPFSRFSLHYYFYCFIWDAQPFQVWKKIGSKPFDFDCLALLRSNETKSESSDNRKRTIIYSLGKHFANSESRASTHCVAFFSSYFFVLHSLFRPT